MPHMVLDAERPKRGKQRELVDGKLECPSCKEWKPLEDYHNCATRRHGVAYRCKVCACRIGREYHNANYVGPEGRAKYKAEQRGHHFRRTYGLTVEEVENMLANQGRVCGICAAPVRFGVKKGTAHVDHCHTTGKVRGILCHRCNLGLGLFSDNEQSLQAALDYIRLHKGEDNASCRR